MVDIFSAALQSIPPPAQELSTSEHDDARSVACSTVSAGAVTLQVSNRMGDRDQQSARDTLIYVLRDFPHDASALLNVWDPFRRGALSREGLEDQMRRILRQDSHSMPLIDYQAVVNAVSNVGNAVEWGDFYDERSRALQGRRQLAPVIAVPADANNDTSTLTDENSDQQASAVSPTGATLGSSNTRRSTVTAITESTSSSSERPSSDAGRFAPTMARLEELHGNRPSLTPILSTAVATQTPMPVPPNLPAGPDTSVTGNTTQPHPTSPSVTAASPAPAPEPVLPPQVAPNAALLDEPDPNDVEDADGTMTTGCQAQCCAIL